jgi:hypothetical protein
VGEQARRILGVAERDHVADAGVERRDLPDDDDVAGADRRVHAPGEDREGLVPDERGKGDGRADARGETDGGEGGQTDETAGKGARPCRGRGNARVRVCLRCRRRGRHRIHWFRASQVNPAVAVRL